MNLIYQINKRLSQQVLVLGELLEELNSIDHWPDFIPAILKQVNELLEIFKLTGLSPLIKHASELKSHLETLLDNAPASKKKRMGFTG